MDGGSFFCVEILRRTTKEKFGSSPLPSPVYPTNDNEYDGAQIQILFHGGGGWQQWISTFHPTTIAVFQKPPHLPWYQY